MANEMPPSEFKSWEEARDFYSLEALLLVQLYDRSPIPRNERRAKAAARRAEGANARCAVPYTDED